MSQLIFIRHGIRGVTIPANLIDNAETLPYLGFGTDLTMKGVEHSITFANFCRETFGKPDLIYTDGTTNRTVNTAIAIAKVLAVNKIAIGREKKKDIFLDNDTEKTEKTVGESAKILRELRPEIEKVKRLAESNLPTLTLKQETIIASNGKITGLLPQLYVLAELALFSQISEISFLDYYSRETLAKAYSYRQMVEFPMPSITSTAANRLLSGISYLLQNQKLTLLVGHRYNINAIAQLLGKAYVTLGYPEHYVQANSGFIFTLKKNRTTVKIDYIWLSEFGKFHRMKYMKISLPKAKFRMEDLLFLRI